MVVSIATCRKKARVNQHREESDGECSVKKLGVERVFPKKNHPANRPFEPHIILFL